MIINWEYVDGDAHRWDEQMGSYVGKLEWLLQIGMHYDEVIQLRRLATKARLVSDYLDEVEKRTNGVVSTSDKEDHPTGS